jgi:hypothetical protein
LQAIEAVDWRTLCRARLAWNQWSV